jgi:TfoX/Sxy family transcriptional regulator of competence genes
MAEPYLSELQSIVEQVALNHALKIRIQCKHFFGGAAAYVDGRIFMTFTPAGLALKLPEAARNELFRQGATSLRYFPKAPVKKNYAVLPSHVVHDTGNLASWVLQSVESVSV